MKQHHLMLVLSAMLVIVTLGERLHGQAFAIDVTHVSIVLSAAALLFGMYTLLPIKGALQRNKEKLSYRTLMEASPDAIVVLSDEKILFVNQRALDLYGLSQSDGEQLLGKQALEYIHPEDRQLLLEEMKHTLSHKQEHSIRTIEVRLIAPTGRLLHTEAYVSSVRYKKRPAFLISLRDVTERIETEKKLQLVYREIEENNEQLELQKGQLQEALKNLSDIQFSLGVSSILAITDAAGIITHVNDKFCEISKYTKEELIGKTHRLINSGYHPASFFTNMWNTIRAGNVWRGEVQNKAKDGQRYWVDTTIVPFLDANGKPYQYVAIRHDITSRKETERKLKKMNEQLQALVQVDGLTGIGNRRFFDTELDRHWDLAVLNSAPLSIILLDVDHFKLFNDYYGHQAGDECLKEVAATIRTSLLRPDDICARYGGEEFVVLLPNTDGSGAIEVAERIRAALEAKHIPHQHSPVNDYVTISLGVTALLPSYLNDPREFISTADKALYQSKRDGRNCTTFFTPYHMIKEDVQQGQQQETASLPVLIEGYLSSLHAFDQDTWRHSKRVAHYEKQLGEALGLASADCEQLYTAGLLHDIGKMSIPLSILNKPTRLTKEEYEIIQEHPVISYEKLNRHEKMKQSTHLLAGVLHHHERWDGAGYPLGLTGTNIPFFARILAIVDAFDAMTQNRVYQQKKSIEQALLEMERNKGVQFDPEATAVFTALISSKSKETATTQ